MSQDFTAVGRSIPSVNCMVCQGPCPDGKSLVNGTRYHERCHSTLIERIRETRLRVAGLQQGMNVARIELERADSVFYTISTFFGAKRVDVEMNRQVLDRNSVALEEDGASIAKDEAQLRAMYDYWGTYPPDWDQRREIARSINPDCVKCGSRGLLHVHHMKPIGKGGSHKQENLEVLCESCHSEEHGGRDVSVKDKTVPASSIEESAYNKRVALIQQAIANGQRIHFSYTKYEGERSSRTIQPESLEQIGQSLCLHGWCELRSDRRVFAIQRMRRVRVVE